MRFAAFTTVAESAGEATDATGLLDNLRKQTILAEELGFEAMWLGEHHFGPYGAGDIPNPDSAWGRPDSQDVTNSHWSDGEHSAVVASDTAGRGFSHSGQYERRSGRCRFWQGDLAV